MLLSGMISPRAVVLISLLTRCERAMQGPSKLKFVLYPVIFECTRLRLPPAVVNSVQELQMCSKIWFSLPEDDKNKFSLQSHNWM